MAKRNAYPVSLTLDERARLEDMVSCGTACRTVLMRCQILLAADEGPGGVSLGRAEIVRQTGASPATVTHIRKAYVQKGLDAVLTLNRSPNSDTGSLKVSEAVRQRILAIASAPPPPGCGRWTLQQIQRELRDAYGMELGTSTIRRVLKGDQG